MDKGNADKLDKIVDKVLEGSSHQKESTATLDDEMEKRRIDIQQREQKQRLYAAMNIPLLYRGKTLITFTGFSDEVDAAKKALGSDMSIFLSGNCGTGKTHLAVGLMCYYVGMMLKIKGFSPEPLFLPAVEFFLELKKSFDGSGGGETGVLDRYSTPLLLVIDDVGAEKISDWSRQIFYTLIDRRYRNMKQTIITSNLSLDEFAEKFDDRIVSRLCENGVNITLSGEDWRVKKKEEPVKNP